MSQPPINEQAWNEFMGGERSESDEEEKVLIDIDPLSGKLVARVPGCEKKYKVYMVLSDEELESFCEELENGEHGRERHPCSSPVRL